MHYVNSSNDSVSRSFTYDGHNPSARNSTVSPSIVANNNDNNQTKATDDLSTSIPSDLNAKVHT